MPIYVSFDIDTAVHGNIDNWRLEIRDDDGVLVRAVEGHGAPPEEFTWGGEDEEGRLVADGTYRVRASVLDDMG